MVTRANPSSAAARGGGARLAAQAAALSDGALKMIYRLLDGGGDPEQKFRQDLVEWLVSKPDNQATSTAIEIVTKKLHAPRSDDNKQQQETLYSTLSTASRDTASCWRLTVSALPTMVRSSRSGSTRQTLCGRALFLRKLTSSDQNARQRGTARAENRQVDRTLLYLGCVSGLNSRSVLAAGA